MGRHDSKTSEKTVEHRLQKSYYILMHRDYMVALVLLDENTGCIEKLVELLNADELPVGIFPEPRNQCEYELMTWWRERAIPISREGIDRVLGKYGYMDTTCLLLAASGLCLTDNYWIKRVDDEKHTWKNVNFYENDFAKDIGNLYIDNVIVEGRDISPFVPSSSVVGEMKKKWMIEDDVRKLVKLNMNDSRQQCANELIASELHKQLKFNHYVEYRPIKVKLENDTVEACSCDNFTTIDMEFVSAHQLMQNLKTPNDMSDYEYLISVAVEYGLKEDKVREQLEYQIMTDFLLTNTDRHFNNFGFLKKFDNMNLYEMAPIYDTGNALFYKEEHIPAGQNLLEITVSSFTKKEVDLLRYVKHSDLVDLNCLNGFESVIGEILQNHSAVSKEKIEKIKDAFLQKKEYLMQFQQGKKLWKLEKYR